MRADTASLRRSVHRFGSVVVTISESSGPALPRRGLAQVARTAAGSRRGPTTYRRVLHLDRFSASEAVEMQHSITGGLDTLRRERWLGRAQVWSAITRRETDRAPRPFLASFCARAMTGEKKT